MRCKVNFVPTVRITMPHWMRRAWRLGLSKIHNTELHLIRARMRGGELNKAKRGELETPLPFGFGYDDKGRVVSDPDRQVQQAVRKVFETFRRVGSPLEVAKHFRENGLRFPRLIRRPGCPVEIRWGDLEHNRVTRILPIRGMPEHFSPGAHCRLSIIDCSFCLNIQGQIRRKGTAGDSPEKRPDAYFENRV